MPIFVFLGLSLLLCCATLVNVCGGKALILGLFLRRDARKKAEAVRRSLSASLRPSPTNYEAHARAHCMSRLKSCLHC